MHEKYDLKTMLAEIEEDETLDQRPKSKDASQDEIKKMLAQRSKRKKK
jgi:hypothetical protein